MNRFKNLYLEIPNVTQYYLISFFVNCWFMAGNFYYFFTTIATPKEITMAGGLGIIAMIIFEIPTGLLADKIGNKKVILIGTFACATTSFIWAMSQNYKWLLICEISYAFGAACISGAMESEVYESIKRSAKYNLEKVFLKVLSIGNALIYFAAVFAGLVGAALFSITARLPFTAMGMTLLLAFIVAFKIKDFKVKESNVPFMPKELLGIFNKKVAYLIPVLFLSLGAAYAIEWGPLFPATLKRVGYSGEFASIYNALSALIVALIIWQIPKFITKIGYKNSILATSLFFVSGLLSSATTTKAGVLVAIVSMFSITIYLTILTSHINNIYEGDLRATLNSTISFIPRMFIGMTSPLLGSFLNENKFSEIYLFASLIVGIGTISTLILWPKTRNLIRAAQD